MKINKKILIITKHFPPEIDGVGDHSFQLATRLQKNGYDVEILTASNSISENFIIYQNKLENYSCIKELIEIINSSKPDTILFQYVPFSFHIKGLGFWLIQLFNKIGSENYKVILFVHETFERRRLKFKHVVLEYLQKFILFKICSNSSNIITTNILYLKQLSRFRHKLRIARIPSNFEGGSLMQKIENNSATVFSIFGNRSLETILALLQEIYSQKNDIIVHFIGKTDPLLNYNLEQNYISLKAITHISGIVSSSKIAQMIKNSDFYLLPEQLLANNQMGGLSSKSGSTATAFMLGKTLITTKGDMTEDIFKDLETCLFIDMENLTASAKKIIAFSKNETLRKKVEFNALELYENKLAWKNTIEVIKTIINIT